MNMQTVIDQSAALHVKVAYNGEYRRFALQTYSFEHLEQTLRSLYNLESGLPIKVKFQDDEVCCSFVLCW